MRRLIAALCIATAGCASHQPQLGIKNAWAPTQEQWDGFRQSGVYLKRADGSSVFLAGMQIRNALDVKAKIEAASGVKADWAVIEMDTPNAMSMIANGRPIVALSTTYLNFLGYDLDALAATIGHELAHLQLKHSAIRAERDRTTAGIGTAAGTAANFIIPFSGYLVSAAATAYSRSFTRDEERAADHLGLKWAVAAGYDPCGKARVVAAFAKYRADGIPMFSTHPSYTERSELADEYAKKANGRGC